MTEPPAYLAIDPGITSGWAQFDAQGSILAYGQFHIRDATSVLDDLITSDLKTVIVEDYKNHPWMRQKNWSRNDTSKLIGGIEMICNLKQVPRVLQPNTVKAIGYKWAGLDEAPTNHSISHQFDAVAHGVYYLQQQGIRPVGKAMMKNDDSNDV